VACGSTANHASSSERCAPRIAKPSDIAMLQQLAGSHTEMVHAGPAAAFPRPTPAASAELTRQIAAARVFARRVPTVAAARRLGYTLTLPPERGSGAHYTDWRIVNCTFDPARPSELLFDGTHDHSRLLAFSYLVVDTSGAPRSFATPAARWHRHFALCLVDGRLLEREACAGGRGRVLDGRDLWMLHAWIVPGHANSRGTFAPLNPLRMTAG
jgi:hypothetical protein